MRRIALVMVMAIAVTALPATAQAAPRAGVLIVDHGEPPEYNELTYESFRKFFDHLIEMGLVPAWLKFIETGTVTVDVSCPFCSEPSADPTLMDAWLNPHEGPGIFVPASDNLPAHYIVPGGPGLGEPDIFEHVGLQAWHEWELMGGRSPNFDQKLPKKTRVIESLRARYGDRIPVRVGYGIDPRLEGRRMDIRKAVLGLVNRDRVDRLVVSYHGVGFSDIMQTHMIRHEIEEILASIDADVDLTYARPIGDSPHYLEAIGAEVQRELDALPEGQKVAIHLSGHGLSTTTCGDYDCGADSYHRNSQRLFERTKRVIEETVDYDGEVGVFHLYGEGAAGDDDPDDKVDSPLEALAERKKAGFDRVIDIPYEFDSDSRDTLIILRHGYERPIPDWDRHYESYFEWNGVPVKISDASFGSNLKTLAFEDVLFEAIDAASSPSGHDH